MAKGDSQVSGNLKLFLEKELQKIFGKNEEDIRRLSEVESNRKL